MNTENGRKKLTASQEDYLEAIWMLIWREGVARVRDIADWLGVSMPSVSGALKALAERKLVEYSPHKYVCLSDRGMELAEKILARHKMLRKFLTDVLNLDEQLADGNACRIEHAVDELVAQRLSYFVQFVAQNAEASQLAEQFKAFCRQQDPAEGDGPAAAKEKRSLTLADIKPGQKVKVLRLGGSAAASQRLAKAGITPGCVLSVLRVAPLGDPIEIEMGESKLAVRKAEAIDIMVTRLV